MQTDEVDVVIVGTNLVQSILAAALARAGKKVLYVDDAKWYGGEDASLALAEVVELLQRRGKEGEDHEAAAAVQSMSDEKREDFVWTLSGSAHGTIKSLGSLVEGEEFVSKSRVSDYSIDLTSRLVFCRGPAVDVLAESGVSRYMEFQALEGTFFIPLSDTIENQAVSPIIVPQSKSQVFASSFLSMVEKRQLMRFLQFCLDYRAEDNVEWTNERLGALNPGRSLTRPQNKSEDSELKQKAIASPNKSLNEFLLESVRMSPKLCDIAQYAIAHQQSSTHHLSIEVGMKRIGQYLGALGRFGATPFLTPMYGAGELCQGFSRLCAVYGGICALGVKPVSIHECGVQFNQSEESSDSLDRLPTFVKAKLGCVVNASFITDKDAATLKIHSDQIELRCVCIMDASLFDVKFGRAFFVIPPSIERINAIHGVQLDGNTRVCPQGTYLLHLTMQTSLDDVEVSKTQMNASLQSLVAMSKQEVKIKWSCFFYRRCTYDSTELVSKNVYIVGSGRMPVNSAVCMDVEIDDAFERAEKIFQSICPGEDFLPPSETEMRTRQEEQAETLMPDFI